MEMNNKQRMLSFYRFIFRTVSRARYKHRNKGKMPTKVLVMVTNPRSGSTWLFDALRCHPNIEIWESAVFCEYLLTQNYRRYPIDLSNKKDNKYRIEISRDNAEMIPGYRVNEDLFEKAKDLYSDTCGLEKIHPEDYSFDTDRLLKRTRRLESMGVKIVFLFQVRDPRSSISSFLNYQQRNPKWYSWLDDKRLMEYMMSTYKALYELYCDTKGMVVDYSRLVSDTKGLLGQIYSFALSDKSSEGFDLNEMITESAVALTARDKKEKSNPEFLGTEPGKIQGGDDRHDLFFTEYAAELDRCYSYYNKLLCTRNVIPDNP